MAKSKNTEVVIPLTAPMPSVYGNMAADGALNVGDVAIAFFAMAALARADAVTVINALRNMGSVAMLATSFMGQVSTIISTALAAGPGGSVSVDRAHAEAVSCACITAILQSSCEVAGARALIGECVALLAPQSTPLDYFGVDKETQTQVLAMLSNLRGYMTARATQATMPTFVAHAGKTVGTSISIDTTTTASERVGYGSRDVKAMSPARQRAQDIVLAFDSTTAQTANNVLSTVALFRAGTPDNVAVVGSGLDYRNGAGSDDGTYGIMMMPRVRSVVFLGATDAVPAGATATVVVSASVFTTGVTYSTNDPSGLVNFIGFPEGGTPASLGDEVGGTLTLTYRGATPFAFAVHPNKVSLRNSLAVSYPGTGSGPVVLRSVPSTKMSQRPVNVAEWPVFNASLRPIAVGSLIGAGNPSPGAGRTTAATVVVSSGAVGAPLSGGVATPNTVRRIVITDETISAIATLLFDELR